METNPTQSYYFVPHLNRVGERGTLKWNYVLGATFSKTPSSKLGSLELATRTLVYNLFMQADFEFVAPLTGPGTVTVNVTSKDIGCDQQYIDISLMHYTGIYHWHVHDTYSFLLDLLRCQLTRLAFHTKSFQLISNRWNSLKFLVERMSNVRDSVC